MSEKAAEFFVIFIVKLGAALVDRHRKSLKRDEDRTAFEEKVELAKASRARQEKQDAAGKITGSF